MNSSRTTIAALVLLTVVACGGATDGDAEAVENAATTDTAPASEANAAPAEPRAWMEITGAREDSFDQMSIMVQPLRAGGGATAEETGTGLSIVLRSAEGAMLNFQHIPLEPAVGTFPLISQQLGEDAGKVEVIAMLPKKHEDVPIPNVPYGLMVTGELEVTDVSDGRLSAAFAFEAFSLPNDEATRISVAGGFEALELPN